MGILDRIIQYLLNWLKYLNQINDCYIVKQLFHYKPNEREMWDVQGTLIRSVLDL